MAYVSSEISEVEYYVESDGQQTLVIRKQDGSHKTVPVGLVSSEGLVGPQGPQGIQGIPGPPGADGEDGTDGVDGAPGVQGPPGPAGANGAPGPQGISGPAGADGAPGIQGPAGADGAPGIQGPIGPEGPEGPSGVVSADAPATYNPTTKAIGVTLGTTSTSAAAGNDPRFTDARVPLSHTHPQTDVPTLVADLATEVAARTLLGSQAVRFVIFTDPSTARPIIGGLVIWVGPSSPTNAETTDLFVLYVDSSTNMTGSTATETDTGFAGILVSPMLGSTGFEVDTGFAGTMTTGSDMQGSLGLETDTGFAGRLVSPMVGSTATETDTGFAGSMTSGSGSSSSFTGRLGVVNSRLGYMILGLP